MHSDKSGVAAISAMTDEGALYTVLWKGTNSARESLLFLIDLEKKLEIWWKYDWKNMKKWVIFLFDNASIYLAEDARKYFAHWWMQAVTFP